MAQHTYIKHEVYTVQILYTCRKENNVCYMNLYNSSNKSKKKHSLKIDGHEVHVHKSWHCFVFKHIHQIGLHFQQFRYF